MWYYHKVNTEVSTVSILTRPANEFMAKIHNSAKRMPVIFDKKSAKEWLKGDIDISYLTTEMNEHFAEYPIISAPLDYNKPHIRN